MRRRTAPRARSTGLTEHFERIIRHFEAAAVPVIVMTPPPIERAKRLTGFYSAEAMASLSRRIVQIADGRAAAVVDLHKVFGDRHGAAREGTTTDGIHLSARAYRHLHDVLEKTVAAVTMRKGQ